MNIKNSVIDIIQSKYQIVNVIELLVYDYQLNELAQKLHQYQNHTFDINDRILVLHHDTDYYPSLPSVGNTMFNFFKLASNFSLPLEKIIFVTNHYGIDVEIEKLSKSICNSPAPEVIQTSQWYDFPDQDSLRNQLTPTDSFSHVYSCLNGRQRQHRVFMLCKLQELGILQQGIVSYNFNT